MGTFTIAPSSLYINYTNFMVDYSDVFEPVRLYLMISLMSSLFCSWFCVANAGISYTVYVFSVKLV